MICNQQNLARISSNPGKTQSINHFEIESTGHTTRGIRKWYLVDLPGYGFAVTSQSDRRRWEQMIENYLRKRKNLLNVFVLIDARHSPQKIDLSFIDQLGKWQVPFTLVFTKTDKEKPAVVERNTRDFLNALLATWQFLPQSFLTSSLKKQGREELLNFIDTANETFHSS